MGFYDEMQEIASNLIGEFAQGSISLIVPAVPTGNAWAPVAGAETVIPLKGVVSGVSRKYTDRGLAIGTDKQITIAVPDTMPEMDHYISVDGQRMKIQHIGKIPEAGTPVSIVIIAGNR